MMKYTAIKCNDSENFCDKSFWTNAIVGKLSANDGHSENGFPTDFYLMKSEGFLYFRFDCTDNAPKAEMSGYNMPLYDEEVVELFFSANKSKNRYLEVEFNHLNGVFCANIDYSKDGNKINFIEKNPIQSFVVKNGGNWQVFGRIPACAIENFESDEWLFNAYRIKRDINNDFILSAFSPTLVENFHMPERFALINFKI